MCKILIVSGIEPGKEKAAQELVIKARKLMTQNDKDGYGYVAYSIETGIFGERWLKPDDAFRRRHSLSKEMKKYEMDLGLAVQVESSYNQFGVMGERSMSTICAHARMATCGVSLGNVHPFYDPKTGTALIHNGIISNHDEFDKRLSTCDSEAILQSYLDLSINTKVENVQKFVDSLEGSFACAVLAHDGKRYVLDIFKNSASNLYLTSVPFLGGYVFATTEEIITKGCRRAKLKHGPVVPFKTNTFLRLDAISGKRLFTMQFEHSALRSAQSWRMPNGLDTPVLDTPPLWTNHGGVVAKADPYDKK